MNGGKGEGWGKRVACGMRTMIIFIFFFNLKQAETSSVASYRPGEPVGNADNASQRSEDTRPASLSSLEELTSGLLRRVTGGRRRLEKQVRSFRRTFTFPKSVSWNWPSTVCFLFDFYSAATTTGDHPQRERKIRHRKESDLIITWVSSLRTRIIIASSKWKQPFRTRRHRRWETFCFTHNWNRIKDLVNSIGRTRRRRRRRQTMTVRRWRRQRRRQQQQQQQQPTYLWYPTCRPLLRHLPNFTVLLPSERFYSLILGSLITTMIIIIIICFFRFFLWAKNASEK